MRVYLVQHGEAVSKEQDPERPLSPQGLGDVERLAAYLAARSVTVARVLHSGKTRARRTAEVLAAALGGAPPEARAGLAPRDPVEGLRDLIEEAEGDLLVAGHQPFLGRAVSFLLCGNAGPLSVLYRPASVVCLERDDSGAWRLAWMLRPELLGT